MNRTEVMELVCNITFRALVREGKSLESYITLNNANVIEEAIELIQFLDMQQTTFDSNVVEQNYNSVLDKILFNS